ncbi:MAG: insulinase family protein [Cyanobacteria bacterium RUI128]|nr:insulinase family protein [Cyanobacteria bacterium RUI128]
MYSYNNSFFNDFRNRIQIGGAKEHPEVSAEQTNTANKEVKPAEMPNVTPDYGVSVPATYSKIGVKKLSNGQEIHCYKLNNGQRVYIAPKEGSKIVLNTYVNTGALNEKDDERGISHFCEHMAFNGTKGTNGYMKLGNSDVHKLVADLGGYTNASTNFAETNYTISIPQFKKDSFEYIVQMQSSMMNNLELSQEMTEKEHGPVTSEINMYSDIPDSIATHAAIKNLYQINTTSDDLVAGRVDNILNVDSKKVTDYYKNNYFPANMTTVVTGDIEPDKAIEIIAKNFKGENPQNPARRIEPLNLIDHTVRKDIISLKAVATSGVICFSGPANNDARGNIELMALNHLMFNKKHSIVSEALEPYGVDVFAGNEKFRTEPSDNTVTTLTYTTTEENSEIALKSIFDKVKNFKAPTDEEMETLKTGLKMKIEKNYEDTEKLNYMIGSESLCGGISQTTDAIKIIDNMTAEDLVNAAKKYYDLNKASIAVIHPDSENADTIGKNYTKAQAISFTGHSASTTDKKIEPLNLDSIYRYKLPNNCEVAITNSNNNIASFSTYITAQTPADTKPGVMELLEDVISKSTDDIVALVDKNNINAFTGTTNSYTYYEAEVPAKNIAVAMSVMKESLFNPDFSGKTFEKAKKDLKTELLTRQPSAFDNLKHNLYPNSPQGYSTKDILNNLDNITLADVKGLHKYLVDNGGITFSASLPMEKYPNIKNVVDRALSEIQPMHETKPAIFNDFVPAKKSVVVRDNANTAQADIIQAYTFPMEHDTKSLTTYSLLNSILSKGEESGLFNNLREKEKLAYSVFSEFIPSPARTGTLVCNILTTTDSPDLKSYNNVQKSIDGFTRQINKIKSGDISDAELSAAKLVYKRELLDKFDNQFSKVSMISGGLNSVNGLEHFNKQYELIDTITKEDLEKAAKHIFAGKPMYSIRASKATIDANDNYLNGLIK